MLFCLHLNTDDDECSYDVPDNSFRVGTSLGLICSMYVVTL